LKSKKSRSRKIWGRIRESVYENSLIPVCIERGITPHDFVSRSVVSILAILKSGRISETWKARWIGPLIDDSKKTNEQLPKTNILEIEPTDPGSLFAYHITGRKKGTGPPKKNILGLVLTNKEVTEFKNSKK
jgi:hypothetical protein